jgi:hypothetical protein
MIKEFVLLALVQVPTLSPDEPITYELQPIEYHATMRECQLSRKVRIRTIKTPSYECLRKDFQ